MNALLLLFLMTDFIQTDNFSGTFRHLDSDGGLSQNSVWAMVQDQRGFMWIATSYGLNRYDGHRVKVFLHEPDNPNSLSGHQCRTLFIDSKGMLWVGTGAGLDRLDPQTEEISRYNIEARFFSSLAEGPDGSIWVGAPKGLFILNPETGETEQILHDNQSFGSVRALLPMGDVVWIGSNAGLVQYNHTSGKVLKWNHDPENSQSLSSNSIRALTTSANGALWIASSRGLDRLDPKTHILTRYKPELLETRDNFVNSVLGDSSGRIWFGAMKDGLSYLNPETGEIKVFSKRGLSRSEISSDDITSLFIDRSNLMWIGTFDSGLSMLNMNPTNFSTLNFPGQKALKNIRTFFQDERGRLWIGAEAGLYRYDSVDNETRFYAHDPNNVNTIPDNQVLTITSHGGYIWVGSYVGGACRYIEEKDHFQRFGQVEGEANPDNTFMKLLADRSGNLWAGTFRGLERFEEAQGGFVQTNVITDKDRDRVQELFEDHKGRLWIGTEKSGVLRYSPEAEQIENLGNFSRYKGQANRINSIVQDEANSIWIGSMAGLAKIPRDVNQVSFFSTHEGLPTNLIYSIIPDKSDLWLSTNLGIVHYSPNDPQPGVRLFDVSDGLQDHDFFRDAGLKTKLGQIYFGGAGGVNFFTPDQLYLNSHIPPIAITSIKIFDEEQFLGNSHEGLVLDYSQNHFSLEYAAMDFHSPQKNQYAYKLEGYNNDWIHVGNLPQTQYTNLPGGEYTFMVKGSNDHGFWNEEGYSLKIRIIPPLWKKSWFLALVVAATLLFIFAIHQFRHRTLKKRNETLELLVQERTRKMESTRQNLLGIARRSGIFEITHGVLGQVEQILPDIKQTIEQMVRQTASLETGEITQAVDLMVSCTEKNPILSEEEANEIPQLLFSLENGFHENQKVLKDSATEVIAHIARMRETISVQHGYAKDKVEVSEIDICELINDALQLEKAHILKGEIKVHKYYRAHPVYTTSRIKLLHVLVQVIRNACEALEDAEEKVLGVRVIENTNQITIMIADTGAGMGPDAQEKALADGYTTKPGHTGFGLYTCIKTMAELGGSLNIEIGKDDKGTMISLSFPRK